MSCVAFWIMENGKWKMWSITVWLLMKVALPKRLDFNPTKCFILTFSIFVVNTVCCRQQCTTRNWILHLCSRMKKFPLCARKAWSEVFHGYGSRNWGKHITWLILYRWSGTSAMSTGFLITNTGQQFLHWGNWFLREFVILQKKKKALITNNPLALCKIAGFLRQQRRTIILTLFLPNLTVIDG